RYARPTQAERVWARIREVRGGATSESAFGRRHRGSGTYAELLAQRFAVAHRRLGYGPPPELVTDRFRPPGAPGQMALC
ncbi:MAG TPA: radical SAM protein, partial [Gammaproteobacteria bacterium]